MVCCSWRCRSNMLGNFWMMKRLKAISFYECTRGGMKVSQHLLLVSPVTHSEHIYHLSRLPLFWSSVALVHRVCWRRPSLHTNRSLSLDSNEKRPLCVWSSNQSLHAFAIDWLHETLEAEETLPNSRISAATTLQLSVIADGVVLIWRDVM